jgi:hypothetical protein
MQFAGHANVAGRVLLGAFLASIGLAILAVMEWSAALYAIDTAPKVNLITTPFGDAPRDAVIYASLSVLFGLGGFFGKVVAGIRADDERPHVRSSAWKASLFATLCMAVPVGNFAHALAFKDAQRAFEVNRPSASQPEGSMAWRHAVETVERGEPQDPAVEEAQRLLNAPSKGEPTYHWLLAAALAFMAMQCGSAFRVPLPITEQERAAMVEREKRQERNRQRRERRKLNKRLATPTTKAGAPLKTWPFVKA